MTGCLRSPSGATRLDIQALFLFTAGILSGVLFSLPEPLSDAIGGACTLTLLFMVMPHREEPHSRGRLTHVALRVGIAAAGIASLLLFPTGPGQALALAALLLGVHLVRAESHQLDSWLPAASATLMLLAALLALVDGSAWADPVFGGWAALVSSIAGMIVGRAVDVGATHAGLYLTALFILYACAVGRYSKGTRRALVKTAGVCGALVLVDVGYLALWSLVSGARAAEATGLLQPFADSYDVRFLLFLLLLLPVSLSRPVLPIEKEPVPLGGRDVRVAVPLAVVLAVSLALVGFEQPATTPDRNVLVYDSIPGESRVDVPVFGLYGLENGGMFGLLPEYLVGRGYSVRMTKELSKTDLAWAGTLVIFNLRSTLGAATDRAVRDFIEGGGSLLLAGDHTGREEIREPSNALLEPYGLTLDFDSAIPVRDGWINGLDMRSHPVMARARQPGMQVLIGASLTVLPPARTLLVGRDGYSDPGNEENLAEGFLGNMQYDRGERFGDIALVAESSAGAGRVLVFGDTTPFQNAALPHSYAFIDDVFAWLAVAPSAASARIVRAVAGVLLVIACIVLLVVVASTRGGTTMLSLAALAMLAATIVPSMLSGAPGAGDTAFGARYAVVDLSHFEAADRWRSSESVDGLALNLQRNGYACFLMPEFDPALVRGAAIVVVPTPLEPFERVELQAVDECVRAGGLLIVTAGAEHPAGSFGLLDYYGFSLGTAPLGQATAAWGEQIAHFWSAWPVEARSGSNVRVIAKAWDYPVVVYRPEGAGGVLVVGDGAFLLNKNLEDNRSYNEHNILFFREILRWVEEGRATDA